LDRTARGRHRLRAREEDRAYEGEHRQAHQGQQAPSMRSLRPTPQRCRQRLPPSQRLPQLLLREGCLRGGGQRNGSRSPLLTSTAC
jgi:hypothetical protein